MTDLEKAVMNTDTTEIEDDSPEEIEVAKEIIENVLYDDDIDEIKVEARKKTNIRFAAAHTDEAPRPVRRRYHYIGTFSAAASLILMGIAMTVSLFSPTGILAALKVAPLMLVFLGLEIGLAVFVNRSARIRYNLKSLILTFSLIVVSFIMSLISVTNSATGGERYYACERLENMLKREFSYEVNHDAVKDILIDIHLYGDNPAEYDTIKDLKSSDVIDLEIQYIDAQVTMYEFAGNCRRIMDSISKMPYNFGTIAFVADDDVNSYRLEVNWLYQHDFSTTELIPLVNYFGNNIIMDIPDLVDDE